ncbi:hypothetical protein [Nannocystis sp.]|uniref:hypothetical protein n=1 Tax=Nannocystis sp. TaxID=1962667 RepID=UPI0025F81F7E|nr:hypothetical protein [Nannocystis sp.]MBK7828046.1 hypothetical protein [Nannocystis sp.]
MLARTLFCLPRVSPSWLARWMVGLLVGGLACGLGCGGGGGDASAGEDAGESGGSSGEGPAPSESLLPSDTCSQAPPVGQGRFSGTLRDRDSDSRIGGVCGAGGPDVFLRIEVPLRADLRVEARGNGFTPRVSLAPLGCLKGSMLACGADGVVGLTDLEEGTVLDLAIGIDQASFMALSDVAAPLEGDDPLDFEVDVGMTRVLGRDEVCRPAARGRCSSGTLCMPALKTVDDDPENDDAWVCTAVPANSCEDPERVTVVLVDGAGTLSVDPDQPQTDAHHHSCTGEGTRERVLRLALPPGQGLLGGRESSLDIWAERPEIGLALRAPGCLASDELDCSRPAPGGSRVTIVAPDELERVGVEPYLFVELPEPGVLSEPVTLHLRQTLRGPPVGSSAGQ